MKLSSNKNSAKYFKIETFGAVDGPGTRLVVFLQGCYLRCIYCHNPESWSLNNPDAKHITVDQIIDLYEKNKNFYEPSGGITISGGEPCIHLDFLISLAIKCKAKKIHLAIDTAGSMFMETTISKFEKLIKYVDLFLVDIKHINNQKFESITQVNNNFQHELLFIKFLEKHKKHYWIRQVLVQNFTDNMDDLYKLGKYLSTLKYMTKFELLPYHDMANVKYENLKIDNPYKNKLVVSEPKYLKECMDQIKKGMNLK